MKLKSENLWDQIDGESKQFAVYIACSVCIFITSLGQSFPASTLQAFCMRLINPTSKEPAQDESRALVSMRVSATHKLAKAGTLNKQLIIHIRRMLINILDARRSPLKNSWVRTLACASETFGHSRGKGWGTHIASKQRCTAFARCAVSDGH